MSHFGLKFLTGVLTGLALAGCGTESMPQPSESPSGSAKQEKQELTRAIPGKQLIPHRYIVVLQESKGSERMQAQEVGRFAASLAQEHGARVARTYTHALRGFVAEIDDARVESLRKDPRVAFVEQDAVMNIATEQSNATWGLDRIDQ
ncbi:protease inhibitor I9 family protein, partial [Hyalangium sp.]|uniref:protease inhibitor I9 family protein n=1 Tax=Hyalangium sp. TaxID=2028555 RepID=UPI002D572453